jgi:CheY-like chemotaxis protein
VDSRDLRPSTLVVDPDVHMVSRLAAMAEAAGYSCIAVQDFPAARRELHRQSPAVVVTNLRLAAFNGIHLAYLAIRQRAGTRVMVYGREFDDVLRPDVPCGWRFLRAGRTRPLRVAVIPEGCPPRARPTRYDHQRSTLRFPRRPTRDGYRRSPRGGCWLTRYWRHNSAHLRVG